MKEKLKDVSAFTIQVVGFVFLFGVLCAMCIEASAIQPPGGYVRRPVAAGCIGRYQVSGNIRIDTVTGRTWEAKRVLLNCALAGVDPVDAHYRLGWYEFIVAPRVRTVPRVIPQRAPCVRPRIVPIPLLQPLPTY